MLLFPTLGIKPTKDNIFNYPIVKIFWNFIWYVFHCYGTRIQNHNSTIREIDIRQIKIFELSYSYLVFLIRILNEFYKINKIIL